MIRELSRWMTFARERFSPLSYLLTVTVFVSAHYAVGATLSGDQDVPHFNSARFAALVAATLAFFFKLRLYDEIKDFAVDSRLNRGRPLVRGLVSHRDLQIGIVVCIVVELAVFSTFGTHSGIAMLMAICYSLLMYKEFFLSRHLRPRLTTYAVTHTAVSILLSLAIFSAVTSRFPWSLTAAHYRLALGSWCLFNIFEFGRKTFSSDEERLGADSYSKVFGRYGAVALVLCMMAWVLWLFNGVLPGRSSLLFFIAVVSSPVVVTGVLYAAKDCSLFCRLYRALSSAYIVFVYSGVLTTRYVDWVS